MKSKFKSSIITSVYCLSWRRVPGSVKSIFKFWNRIFYIFTYILPLLRVQLLSLLLLLLLLWSVFQLAVKLDLTLSHNKSKSEVEFRTLKIINIIILYSLYWTLPSAKRQFEGLPFADGNGQTAIDSNEGGYFWSKMTKLGRNSGSNRSDKNVKKKICRFFLHIYWANFIMHVVKLVVIQK